MGKNEVDTNFLFHGPKDFSISYIHTFGHAPHERPLVSITGFDYRTTLQETNIAMENPPFEDVFPIQDGDFPASYVCLPEGKGPKT